MAGEFISAPYGAQIIDDDPANSIFTLTSLGASLEIDYANTSSVINFFRGDTTLQLSANGAILSYSDTEKVIISNTELRLDFGDSYQVFDSNGYIISVSGFEFSVTDSYARALYKNEGQLLLSETGAHLLLGTYGLTVTDTTINLQVGNQKLDILPEYVLLQKELDNNYLVLNDVGLNYKRNGSILTFSQDEFTGTFNGDLGFKFSQATDSLLRYSLERGYSFSSNQTSFYHKRFNLNGLFLDDDYTILANSASRYILLAQDQGFFGVSPTNFLSLSSTSSVLTCNLGEKELILSDYVVLKRDSSNYLLFGSDGSATLKNTKGLLLASEYINTTTETTIDGYRLNQLGLRFEYSSGASELLTFPQISNATGNPTGNKSEIRLIAGNSIDFTIGSDPDDPWIKFDVGLGASWWDRDASGSLFPTLPGDIVDARYGLTVNNYITLTTGNGDILISSGGIEFPSGSSLQISDFLSDSIFRFAPEGKSIASASLYISGGGIYIPGKLTVDGLVDPTGFQFDPQTLNPGNTYTLWANQITGELYYGNIPLNPASGALGPDFLSNGKFRFAASGALITNPTLVISGGGVYIPGKLTVDGLIDPTGLELTLQGGNPGNGNTLWLSSGISGAVLYVGANRIVASGSDFKIGLPTDGHYGTASGSIAGLQQGDRVEDALDKLDLILGKLAPAKPPNLADILMEIVGSYSALLTADDSLVNAVIDDQTPTVVTGTDFIPPGDGFWDASDGTLSAFIDSIASGTITLTTGDDTGVSSDSLLVLADYDYYSGVAGKENFWFALGAQIEPTHNLIFGNHVAKMTHSVTGSTQLTFGVDDPQAPTIAGASITPAGGTGTTYYSGVPTMDTGEAITADFTVNNAIYTYYNATRIARAQSDQTTDTNEAPTGGYIYGGSHIASISVTVEASKYTEDVSISCYGYNSKGNSGSSDVTNNVRIDTNSNESARVLSGAGQYPGGGYGGAYVSTTSLVGAYTEELQMLNGQYQFPPAVNYSSNVPTAGPNYSAIGGGTFNNFRWVTFTFTASANTAIRIDFNNTSNFPTIQDGLTNFALYVDGPATTGWVDGDSAYPGVGNPTNNGDPALDLGASTTTSRRITFGAATQTGTVYVRVGIKQGSTIRFGSVTITSA